MYRRLVTAAAVLGVVLVGAPRAGAQGIARTLDELRLLTRPGQTVTLTDTGGAEVTGRITSLSAAAIEVEVNGGTREWKEGEVRTIRQRIPDSLGNGALWGFGIGAGLMTVAVASAGVDDGDAGWAVLAVAAYGGVGAAIGVGIDALIRSKQVIYERPDNQARWRLSPFVSPVSMGARLTLRF